MFLEKKYFFMRYKPQRIHTTLEATLRRRNSLSPTGTRVYLHLNLIGFYQIVPLVLFSPCTNLQYATFFPPFPELSPCMNSTSLPRRNVSAFVVGCRTKVDVTTTPTFNWNASSSLKHPCKEGWFMKIPLGFIMGVY